MEVDLGQELMDAWREDIDPPDLQCEACRHWYAQDRESMARHFASPEHEMGASQPKADA